MRTTRTKGDENDVEREEMHAGDTSLEERNIANEPRKETQELVLD